MKKDLHYNSEDEKLLKVAKLNSDLSEDLLKKARELNNKDVDDSFVTRFENALNISAEEIEKNSSYTAPMMPKKEMTERSFDEIAEEALLRYPGIITFDDLLSDEEINRAMANLDSINKEFSKKTSLKKVDVIFLFTAVALQCLRQYLLDPYIKKCRKNSGPKDEGKGRKGNPDPGWYYAETDKILVNKVPFDAQRYNKNADSKVVSTIDGFLKGAKDHRYVTLGHDPLLGWVFGTANILTNTITRYDLQSAHVKYKAGVGPVIHSLAETPRIFTSTTDRAFQSGLDGKIAVGSAVLREGIHLKSDMFTSDSLAIPGVSMISPKIAEDLASYGIDMASVGTEIALSSLINTLISMVHRLFYDESVDDKKLYEVRTRKVLLYSNLIASSSNIVVTAITKNAELLDVGGLIVTIIRLFKDIRFITKVKKDFIESKLDMQFQGIVDETEKLYVKQQHIELF
ncbi:MAG: hypothetical protein IKF64_08095 [Eubacterium sp.]|nr:hypothetical protein [Eubacterium sp.]